MKWRKIIKICKKEALTLKRSPGRVCTLFLFPIFMIFFFGMGFGPYIELVRYGSLEYIDFLTPAIIITTVFLGGVQWVGQSLAGERAKGTFDRLIVTPATTNDIIAGKTMYTMVVQVARAMIVTFLVSYFFDIKMRGSWPLVLIIEMLTAITSIGLGIFLSLLTQDESTARELGIVVVLPFIFISGVFFPLWELPLGIRLIAFSIPLTYAIKSTRQVMLAGYGLTSIRNDLLILTGFAIGFYLLSVWLFNYTMQR